MATTSLLVEVVLVSSPEKQQEALRRFHGVAGLTALGTSSDDDHFVVVECVDQLMKSAAEIILGDIDHHAVCTYVSGPLSLIAPDPVVPTSIAARELTHVNAGGSH